jgi:hypothetical protein
MTRVTLELTPETENRLRLRASRRGETLEAYLNYLAEREAAGAQETPDMLEQGLEWLTRRGAEEVGAARKRVLGASSPPRDMPAGETIISMVEGKWPGTETDTEIQQALDRLS